MLNVHVALSIKLLVVVEMGSKFIHILYIKLLVCACVRRGLETQVVTTKYRGPETQVLRAKCNNTAATEEESRGS
jgi:hypothetical protein